MSHPLKAARAFRFFGHSYSEDDPIDTTNWPERTVLKLLAEYPVYFDQSISAGPESDPVAGPAIATETSRALAAEAAEASSRGGADTAESTARAAIATNLAAEVSRATGAEATNAGAISAHTGAAAGAHAASAISFSPSGLLIVTGTTAQAALAQLDAAVASAQTVEGGYVENDTAKPGGANAGVMQALAADPPADVNLMVLAIPANPIRPIYVRGRVVFRVTAQAVAGKTANCQLIVADDTGTDLEQAMCPFEGGGGTNGFSSCMIEYRIPPGTAAHTYKLQASYNRGTDTTFAAAIMHGSLAASFRSWMKWEYR